MDKTLYLRSTNEDIGKYVIFSGDPRRVEKIIGKLENVEKVAVSREFHTYTGFYKGIKVTISSTGIGGPSAAIALEEMYSCGMEVAIRLGTVMGLKEDLLGKLVIPIGAMGKDATRTTYVDAEYPAIADFDLVSCMNESAKNNGVGFENGIVTSFDGYYSQMKDSDLSKKLGIDVSAGIARIKKLGMIGIDMETSTVLTLSRLMGVKACVVTLTTVLENLVGEMDSGDRKNAEENDLIDVVLGGIYEYEKRSKE